MNLERIQGLSEDTQLKMNQVFDWFNANVARLESAYQDIGIRFDKISQELSEKNEQLIQLFLENEAIQTQLRSVLGSLKSGVIMISVEQKVTLFNPAAEKIYGLKKEEVLGRHYADKLLGSDKSNRFLLDTLKKTKGYVEREKYWKIDNKVRPIGFTTSIVKDPRGKVLGAVEISTDLTQMKKMQTQIQHSKTLAALGQMAATVAHEIRNPLGAIGGFAGLLERDLDVNDSRRALVTKIVQGVSSLNKIVSNLLVFSRPMELQVRQVDFIEWIEEILRYAEIEAGRLNKKIAFKKSYSHEKYYMHLDPEKFQQVLLNIMFNAIQSIAEEGVVSVKVRIEPDRHVTIDIRDSGSGISEEYREKIFDPFFTTKEQGTGLGLAIVRRIVELHGGAVTVDSEPGSWTAFSIRLGAA